MIKNRLRFAGVGIIGSILALVLILAPVPSHAKEKAKDAGSVAVLEKKMLAKSTKKISFRQGKIRSTSRKVWKKGKKIKKSEKTLSIKKKGWYTLCVTTTSGKKKLTHLYFEKKKYEITIKAVPCSTGIQMNEALQAGEIDIAGPIIQDLILPWQKMLRFLCGPRATMPAVCGRLKVPAVKRFA